jgi:peptidoglycan hydrolase-like protein with peptidoglycan-binding domain
VVEAWQTDVGMEVDGRVDLGEVVFLPEPVTVKAVSAGVGTSVGSATPIVQIVPGFGTIEGADVTQLQQALARLGYDVEATGVLDQATQDAVRDWQAALGAPIDGVVDLGEVIFLAGPVRVTDALVGTGAAVRDGTAVLGTSGDTSVVSVDLPASQQELIAEGDSVTVVLPDDTEVPGTVTSISGIATRSAGDITFATTIDVGELDTTLDQAPVDVLVVTDSRPGVLAVPVTALVALAEGGYALEVGDLTATHLVAVTPGLYADGWVEVDSPDLAAGDMVVVP